MTTIAFDGVSVAFDTMSTQGGRKTFGRDQKMIRIRNHQAIEFAGGCGELDAVNAFQQWVVDGMVPKAYPSICTERMEESCFMVITSEGVSMDFERRGEPVSKDLGITSIGSGSDYALGAMAAGKTAAESVAIAMQFDAYTGGEIVSMDLNSTHSKGRGEGGRIP